VDTSQTFEEALIPCTLTESEMRLRDKFAQEYITDYDAYATCVRIGYSHTYAIQFAIKFMQEPYVQQAIKKLETTPDEMDEAVEKKKILAGMWREANFHGAGSSQAARVAALSKLSAFYGMDAPTRSKSEITGPDGLPLGEGVFVVPGIVSAEDWAKAAEKQQADLVRPSAATPELKVV
jgi:hypothetical protein